MSGLRMAVTGCQGFAGACWGFGPPMFSMQTVIYQ